jgi:hypothetical protein
VSCKPGRYGQGRLTRGESVLHAIAANACLRRAPTSSAPVWIRVFPRRPKAPVDSLNTSSPPLPCPAYRPAVAHTTDSPSARQMSQQPGQRAVGPAIGGTYSAVVCAALSIALVRSKDYPQLRTAELVWEPDTRRPVPGPEIDSGARKDPPPLGGGRVLSVRGLVRFSSPRIFKLWKSHRGKALSRYDVLSCRKLRWLCPVVRHRRPVRSHDSGILWVPGCLRGRIYLVSLVACGV